MLLEYVVDLDHGYKCVWYPESIVCKFRHNCNIKYFKSTLIKIASNYLDSTIVVLKFYYIHPILFSATCGRCFSSVLVLMFNCLFI